MKYDSIQKRKTRRGKTGGMRRWFTKKKELSVASPSQAFPADPPPSTKSWYRRLFTKKTPPTPLVLTKMQDNHKQAISNTLYFKKNIGPENYYTTRYCLNQSGECMTFGRNIVIQEFFQFTNFQYVVPSSIRPIGEDSINGFVVELCYERNKIRSYAILKNSLKKSSDNLYYEYLVGKYFINYWNIRIPCFIETYGLFLNQLPLVASNSESSASSLHTSTNITINDLQKFKSLSKQPEKQILSTACQHSSNLSLLIQHIHQAKTLREFLTFLNFFGTFRFLKNPEGADTYIQNLLYQVYAPLAYLMREFTHYDLHSENVLLYSLNEEEYMELIYIYSEDKQIRIFTQHICKIIDYGRSYANTPETLGLYEQLCKEISCNQKDSKCGNNDGFTWLEDKDNLHSKNYWISSQTNNISHDLRLYNIYERQKNKKKQKDSNSKDSNSKDSNSKDSNSKDSNSKDSKKEISYNTEFGTAPAETNPTKKRARNVLDVKKLIESRLSQDNPFPSTYTQKATLSIYLDGTKRPMRYEAMR